MLSGSDSESEREVYSITGSVNTKKRKVHGRITDVMKKIRLQSHELGKDCQCKRLKCFSETTAEERQLNILNFNQLQSVDEQNSFLSGLISVVPVNRRRSRKPNREEAQAHDASYAYKVRVVRNTITVEVPVCYKAFLSMFGIGKKKLEFIQHSLKMTGLSPRDGRGKHNNRPRQLKDDVINKINDHIGSFKGRKSHYSMKKTDRMYLPETLNIKKMFDLFKSANPSVEVSYESYRNIFNSNFNLCFGYPRSDTCTTCDRHSANVRCIDLEIANSNNDIDRNALIEKLRQAENKIKLHKIKASVFYKRKRTAKRKSRQLNNFEAICMDFGKNLPIPNLTTNDIYYKRQLSFFSFNIHILSDNRVFYYTYNESVGKKGSDAVISILHHFIRTNLDSNVRDLHIFCDSCGGQNKNYSVFRFLHFAVHEMKRFDSIRVTFPVRGHSYMQSDTDMALVNQKTPAETPSQWNEAFETARSKPTPYKVIDMDLNMFRKWTDFLSPLYVEKCPFPVRPIKEIQIGLKVSLNSIEYRNSYNGAWYSSAVVEGSCKKKKKKNKSREATEQDRGEKLTAYKHAANHLQTGEFLLPNVSSEEPLKISQAKFKDLQDLKHLCGPAGKKFLDSLMPACD